MKKARNDKIHEFCRLPNYRVPGVTGSWNRPWSQKKCATAHENGQKWQNSRVLSTSKFPCTGVTSRWNHPRKQKPCAIAHENGQKWQKSRVLSTSKLPCRCAVEIVPGVKTVCQKQCAIAHENGQKWQNSQVFMTSKLPCTGGHDVEISPETKNRVL